jgi:hypothetical protein
MKNKCTFWMERTSHTKTEYAEGVKCGCTLALHVQSRTMPADSMFFGVADYSAGGRRVSSSQVSAKTAKSHVSTRPSGGSGAMSALDNGL